MRYGVTLLLFLLFYTGALSAQVADSVFFEGTTGYDDNQAIRQEAASGVNPASLSQTKIYSAEKIAVRKFDPKKWKEIVGTTDYNEGQTKKKPKKKVSDQSAPSKSQSGEPGKRYLETEEDDMDEPEPDTGSSMVGPLMGLVLKILFYGIVIAIIVFILYYIMKNISFKSKLTNATIGTPDFTTHVEDIAELDIDHLLQKTLAAGDFRLAIRMCFLGLLKKLNEEGFIVWKKDKTNRDYLTELFSKPSYFEEVRRLTLAYEQIWYGDHTLPVESYQRLITEFKSIDQKLHTSKPR